jgi:hypothetical protein
MTRGTTTRSGRILAHEHKNGVKDVAAGSWPTPRCPAHNPPPGAGHDPSAGPGSETIGVHRIPLSRAASTPAAPCGLGQ